MKKTIAMSVLISLPLQLSANELSTGMELSYHTVNNSDISPMIIDGVSAIFEDHPHYAAMAIIPDEFKSGNSFSYIRNCGASILNDRFILTAAHCVEDSVYTDVNTDYGINTSWENSYVIVGVSDINKATFNNFYKVKTRHVHPSYLSIVGEVGVVGFEKYDIAVLELEEAITHNVGSINHKGLNPSVYDQLDEWHATGMGKTSPTGSPTDILLTTPLSPGNDVSGLCSLRYSPETTICTTDLVAGFGGTCQGDSGGPITYIDNGKHIQIGVVSYGTDPCGTGYSVFTEVAAYESWIDGIVTHGEEKEYVSGASPIDDSDENDSDDSSNENNDSGGDSGGSIGLLTLFGLGLLYRRKK